MSLWWLWLLGVPAVACSHHWLTCAVGVGCLALPGVEAAEGQGEGRQVDPHGPMVQCSGVIDRYQQPGQLPQQGGSSTA